MTEALPSIEQQNPTENRNRQPRVENLTQTNFSEASPVSLPRITIKYCTQCKWMLRAAYFAQELLSTFGTSIGEIALIPSTGGIFTVTIITSNTATSSPGTEETLLWDRKTNGGFPEVKQLKASVRNIIEPSRDLGHVDRALEKAHSGNPSQTETVKTDDKTGTAEEGACTDCQ